MDGKIQARTNLCRALLILVLSAIAFAVPIDSAGEKTFGKNRDVPYVPTSSHIIESMLSVANVTGEDFVIDLGCGDGRIVIAAAKLGARGLGIDIDPERIDESNKNARQERVSDRVNFLKQDLFKTDISRATVLTMYLLPSVNMKLRPRLLRELKPGTRIVSHDFDLEDWEPDKKMPNIFFWIVPANISGRWRMMMNGGTDAEMTLELEQKFQKVKGRMLLGQNVYALEDVILEGGRLEFTVQPPDRARPVRWTCSFSGDAVHGKMESAGLPGNITITGQREPGTGKEIDA